MKMEAGFQMTEILMVCCRTKVLYQVQDLLIQTVGCGMSKTENHTLTTLKCGSWKFNQAGSRHAKGWRDSAKNKAGYWGIEGSLCSVNPSIKLSHCTGVTDNTRCDEDIIARVHPFPTPHSSDMNVFCISRNSLWTNAPSPVGYNHARARSLSRICKQLRMERMIIALR